MSGTRWGDAAGARTGALTTTTASPWSDRALVCALPWGVAQCGACAGDMTDDRPEHRRESTVIG